MVRFIDDHRATYGVEPICAVLPIAPSTYFLHTRGRGIRHSGLRAPSATTNCGSTFSGSGTQIIRSMDRGRSGSNWGREDVEVARCTVERLMGAMGLAGAVRGRAWITTTDSASAVSHPPDLVDREFAATRPNQLWVSDFTYVATWRGFVYVAFVIDVFARRIVGWRVSASLRTDFVLDALEQAVCERGAGRASGLVHHSDRGTQYLSMWYTDRLLDAGIAPSVGSQGDAYDCEHDGVAVRAGLTPAYE